MFSDESLHSYIERLEGKLHYYQYLLQVEHQLVNFLFVVMVTIAIYNLIKHQRHRDFYTNRIRSLDTAAKAKLHDIRNNYTVLLYLLDNNRFEDIKLYTERSASFYSIVLNSWDSRSWTLADEITILTRFYEAERVLHGDVEIGVRCEGVDVEKSLFISEVFTTLLHNSMVHGFKRKDPTERRTFSIEIRREKKYLWIDVKDNGHFSEKANWFEKSDSGLSILGFRIRYELKKHRRPAKDYLRYAKREDGDGTHIKMKFPYAVSS